LGPLLALIAYLAVVNWQYPGGWIKAAGIALFAAVASLVVLYVMAVGDCRLRGAGSARCVAW